ncbi:ligase-associated DNA damage response endonuclease PdeM [Taibaiella soli]|uniref:Ligase-associated DNA damage response endonuclease PdeM n=1 Tax=Taibaiella soli TaxID=1649169 RepID=A0A2W2ALT2_9BACT|nr:ligase-associated DNA damage response endonuclease PdeM [Taibaiella soli]PZF73260.1 ligase-associated DNA damage response endonuclease PdeM [Taibaiella soli]
MNIVLHGNTFRLLPEKALFWEEYGLMIIADLHLGKAMHFRKAGIPMPELSALKDYENLNALIGVYHPEQICFLGDLFHSNYNTEWRLFETFIEQNPHVHFSLIKGNHDILKDEHYEALGIELIDDQLALGNVILSHIPITHPPEGNINISGHLHPGCVLRGLGRQSVKLPCFVYYRNTFLLPAFGHLTGLHVVQQIGAVYYAIAGDRIVMM